MCKKQELISLAEDEGTQRHEFHLFLPAKRTLKKIGLISWNLKMRKKHEFNFFQFYKYHHYWSL